VRIRLANTDDVPRLNALAIAYSLETEQHGTERNERLLCELLLYGIRAGEAVVVAEQDGDLVGFCAWVHLPHSPPTKVEGLGTYVVPPARRDHVSCALRKFAEEHAYRMGYRYVDGIAARDNPAGLESVLRRGFRVVGVHVRRDFQQPETATPRDESRGAAAVENVLNKNDETVMHEMV